LCRSLIVKVRSVMDDIIRRAIADLSALSKVASPRDAERIQEIIDRMQSLDAHDQHAVRLYQKLTLTFRKLPPPWQSPPFPGHLERASEETFI
jgi:hypothetical protein